MGITDASELAIAEILQQVKQRGIEKRALVTLDEFKTIVESVLAAKP